MVTDSPTDESVKALLDQMHMTCHLEERSRTPDQPYKYWMQAIIYWNDDTRRCRGKSFRFLWREISEFGAREPEDFGSLEA